jgi:carbamoyltransferase
MATILGIHGGVTNRQHDASAALIRDGELVAACEEERFSRMKGGTGALPVKSIKACLREAGISISDVDLVVHPGETYEDMPARIELYFRHYFGKAPKRLRMINHHLAHMASAYYCSPFEKAMILSYDGIGDRLSTVVGVGDHSGIQVLETWSKERSLGIFYLLMTSFLGFRIGEDEYKVMGLAPYGAPGVDLSPIISWTDDSYDIDTSFFERTPAHISAYEPFYNQKLVDHLGPAREPDSPILQRHRDIAFATQHALEESAKALIRGLHQQTQSRNLCLAGGVALNCSANHTLRRTECIDHMFVQPAASDRGLALGCALQGAFEEGEAVRGLNHVYLGPSYSDAEIERALKLAGAAYDTVDDPAAKAAQLIHAGKIVGWWQGRAEFGPRALGNRSILADPRPAHMKDTINARVKFREEFRPFAPAVLEERACEIFEMKEASPFMTEAFPVRREWQSRLEAITHVNGTARVQTVGAEANPLFHRLITRFDALSGVPVVLNTSFNVRGQPIVETVFDALSTFSSTGMDAMVVGRHLLMKG